MEPGFSDPGRSREWLSYAKDWSLLPSSAGTQKVILVRQARIGRLRDPVCTTAFGAAPALECAYLAGAKIAEQSPSRIKERDPRKTGLFFANTATVKSSERRSRSCHVERARFQTKCSCEAPSVNE